MNSVTLHGIARGINDELARKTTFRIGITATHRDGRTVEITSGSFYGGYGGISNFWEWREVLHDGTLGPIEKGYGTEICQ